MVNLTELAINKKPVTYFVILLLIIAGCLSFFKLNRLEDPEFSVKVAVIVTTYPGASAEQVELEVTDPISKKIQEMAEIKNLSTLSRPGLSIVKVYIQDQYWSNHLAEVWDHLREKMHDVIPDLPPGATRPVINDHYGYVFGFLLATSSDGYNYAELEKYTKQLQKVFYSIPGVSEVILWGVQPKRIYLDIANTQYSQLGITPANLQQTLQLQNQVVDAGGVDYQQQRWRIAPTGEFSSAAAIGDLAISSAPLLNETTGKRSSEIIRIRDFATVKEEYITPPQQIMRYNGLPAIAIALAMDPGVNVMRVGQDIEKYLKEQQDQLPVGIEMHKISWQSDLIAKSTNAFMIHLFEAMAIIFLVLMLVMGVRAGIIIGTSNLILTILGTLIVMKILDIDLQRISLGALVIAMGIIVDDAIVVTDSFMTRIQQGISRKRAAIDAASHLAWPLLSATIIVSVAFYPIFASNHETGEYARSLFIIVATSLFLSWLLAQTITPLMCMAFLTTPKQKNHNLYRQHFYASYQRALVKIIHYRTLFLISLLVLLGLAVVGFRFVPILYFPDSSRLQLMIDYWAPEGTRIQQTSSDIKIIENKLLAEPGVNNVTTFIGQGPPRIYLPVEAEYPSSSYAQLIVNTANRATINRLVNNLPAWGQQHLPQAMVRVRKYSLGAFSNWQFAARFRGPANANPQILRQLADQAVTILQASPYAKDIRTDWRERVLEIVPEYNQERGRWTGISRLDLAQAMKRSYDGLPVGLYREEDNLIPIIMRQTQQERETAAVDLPVLQITSPSAKQTIPAIQVLDGIKLQWYDHNIWRWDRHRAITVQCSPNGVTATTLRNQVLSQFNKIKLPPGYTLEWDGEYKNSLEARHALIPGLIPAIIIILLMLVVLFNAYIPPLIIIAVIPFTLIGITLGLLITGVPFGFIALLASISLIGMMIRNSVVLLNQVQVNLAHNMSSYHALILAATSRLRPVLIVTVAMVLGVLPLLQDVFWVSLTVTIIFGLTFSAFLTMILVPVLYCMLFRIKPQ